MLLAMASHLFTGTDSLIPGPLGFTGAVVT